jgi:uncharacterized pyridoxamine 5'-phosphate oxidase family protein
MKSTLIDYQDYLEAARIPVRLAVTAADGWPVVLSLWFLHQTGKLYCATQKTAKVVDYLRSNPNCSFEIAGDQPPYCGIRGRAQAAINGELGPEILERLLLRYVGDIHNELSRRLLARKQTEVAIVIEPLSIMTWNFSERMRGIRPAAPPSNCP